MSAHILFLIKKSLGFVWKYRGLIFLHSKIIKFLFQRDIVADIVSDVSRKLTHID